MAGPSFRRGSASLAALLLLAACARNGTDVQIRHGRFSGVGIYSPGPLWSKILAEGRTQDPNRARLQDDEQVIVVIDGDTGEIRECGAFSGYCVGMNPWSKGLIGAQILPVPLSAHVEQLGEPPSPPAPGAPASRPASGP